MIKKLNDLTKPFGIIFDEFTLAKLVHFLDLCLYIDDDGFIRYTLFRKPTDSRHYLKVGSFHPKHVFASVAYSQMLRVWEHNSTVEGANKDLDELKQDLRKCGHSSESLEKLHLKLQKKLTASQTTTSKSKENVLVLTVDYFKEMDQLKKLIHKIEPDISRLVGGDTKLLVSARRGTSIGSKVVQNRGLCETVKSLPSQRCGTPRCETCPLLLDMGQTLNVNGKLITVKSNLNCKSRNVIYLAQCEICQQKLENSYFGQTGQQTHKRVNGHRSCFTLDEDGKPQIKKLEKSALALHCYNEHRDEFSLSNFKFILIKQVRPRDLDRSEFIQIGENRTRVMGLNRIDVQK